MHKTHKVSGIIWSVLFLMKIEHEIELNKVANNK